MLSAEELVFAAAVPSWVPLKFWTTVRRGTLLAGWPSVAPRGSSSTRSSSPIAPYVYLTVAVGGMRLAG